MPSNAAQMRADIERTADALRRLPATLADSLDSEVTAVVADPIADAVRAALTGPFGPAIEPAVTTDVSPEPTVRVDLDGGPVLSEGARVADLAPGVEHGGGRRVSTVPGNGRRRTYRRKSTNQFVPARPFFHPTLDRTREQAFTAWTDLVDKIIREELTRG